MGVKVAKATVPRAKESPKVVAKAKSKEKEKDAEAPTRRTVKRTPTCLGGMPTLLQWGPIQSPQAGSKTRGLGPVSKCKRNKNKEPSVAAKRGRVQPPPTLPLQADGAKASQRV